MWPFPTDGPIAKLLIQSRQLRQPRRDGSIRDGSGSGASWMEEWLPALHDCPTRPGSKRSKLPRATNGSQGFRTATRWLGTDVLLSLACWYYLPVSPPMGRWPCPNPCSYNEAQPLAYSGADYRDPLPHHHICQQETWTKSTKSEISGFLSAIDARE